MTNLIETKGLINVSTNDKGEVVVSGRDLHAGLEIKTPYKQWIDRMIDYGFIEGTDYIAITQKCATAQGNMTTYTDHILKLDKMKDIKGYEGLYAIHPSGKVYSYRSNKFLKGCKDSSGYLKVNLCKGGKVKSCFVHRLVAQTYIHNPENKPQVNHIDGCKENNHVSNLEWCTNSENQKHAWNNGLKEKQREAGKQNCIKNFSKQVEVIFPDGNIETYYSSLEACRQLGLPLCTVTNYIKYCNGYYKKQNLRFRYIEKER